MWHTNVTNTTGKLGVLHIPNIILILLKIYHFDGPIEEDADQFNIIEIPYLVVDRQ